MTIETLELFSIISYVIAGVLLLAAIAQFFLLDVIKLIGDATGLNERHAIEKMRQQKEPIGNNQHKLSPMNDTKNKSKYKSSSIKEAQVKKGSSTADKKKVTTKLSRQSEETTRLAKDATQSESSIVMNQNTGTAEFGVDFQLEFTSSDVIVE